MRDKKPGKKTPARRAVQKKRVVRKPKDLAVKKKRVRIPGTGTPGLNGEGLYASLFENNHAVMLLIDPGDGKIVDANPAACSFYGYTKTEILQKKITDINTLTRKQVFKEMGLAKTERRNYFLCRHRLSSGETRDVEVYSGPVTVRGRRLLYSIIHDITVRKRTEEALLESEEKFRALADHVPVGVIIHRAGILQYVGREAARLMGHENPDEAIGRSIFEFIPEKDRPWIADITWRRIAGESVPAQYEARLLKRDGSIIDALIFAMLIDYGGRQATLTAFVDITERKRAEEALQKAQVELEKRVEERTIELLFKNFQLEQGIKERKKVEMALRQMTDQLSMLLESLPIIPYCCESCGGVKITYVGVTIKNITGYSPESFTENPAFYLDRLHPDDRKRLLENLDNDRQKGRGRYEYRFRIADGTYRWFADIWHCIESAGDAKDYIAGVWQDITEEKRLRQESEVRLQQVIQGSKMAALGEVVAGVVHEVNNPNSFIAYNVPLLEKIWTLCEPVLAEHASTHPGWGGQGVRFDEIRQDMTEIIEAFRIGSDRINKVILNLKDFSRADEGVEMRPLRVNDVIQRTLMIVGGQIRRTVSRMDLRLHDDLPVIRGHFQKLEQVFANLLINACQAVKPDTPGMIAITTRYLDRLKCVSVVIEDNGPGMEPQVVGRLFDPFFTTRRDEGGTGLGLSVSYGLVREHGGVIVVLSRPGVGSRFTVLLPLSREAQPVLHPSILCLDDDIELLEDLRANLTGVETPFYGLRSVSQEVMAYIDDHPEVDIVLYDRTAFDDIAGEIKGRFPLLTLIGCGGEAGGPADYFLAKPFKITAFLEIIDQAGRQRL